LNGLLQFLNENKKSLFSQEKNYAEIHSLEWSKYNVTKKCFGICFVTGFHFSLNLQWKYE
jgi:hypothetical protein